MTSSVYIYKKKDVFNIVYVSSPNAEESEFQVPSICSSLNSVLGNLATTYVQTHAQKSVQAYTNLSPRFEGQLQARQQFYGHQDYFNSQIDLEKDN